MTAVSGNDLTVARAQLGTRAVAHAVDEAVTIVGAAAGLSGDGAGQAHATALHLGGAELEGLDGAVHRFGGQTPALRHALAEANDAGKRVDDLIAAGALPGDQQATVIGAEIQRGHNLTGLSRTRTP